MQLAATAPLSARRLGRCFCTQLRVASRAAPLRLTRAPRRAARHAVAAPAARSAAAIPRGLAISLDLAARRAESVSRGGHALQTPIEHAEAELFHVRARACARARRSSDQRCRTRRCFAAPQAISVATAGPASEVLSAAVVEIAVIMVATGVAARAVHWVAESLGLAEAARVRGEAAETAVLNAVTTTTHAHAPRDGSKASTAAPSEAQAAADTDDYDSLFDDLPHYAPDAAAEEHAREQRHEAPALLHAYLTRPATTLVWATGGAAALRSALRAAAVALSGGEPITLLGVPALTLLAGVWRLTLIACVAWGAAVWASEALERSAAQHPRHAAAYFAARALSRRGIAVAAVLAALSVLRVPLQALVTFGGVSGVVFGIGARAAASNALAGFFMMLTHTLHEGDVVELVGRGIQGVVVDVSLTATTILSQDAT